MSPSIAAVACGMINSTDAPSRSDRAKNSRKHEAHFRDLSKYSPESVDILSLRQYPITSTFKRNQVDTTLSHAGFDHARKASEEDSDPLEESHTFKDSMKSPYEETFAAAMVQEIDNQTKRKI